MSTSRRSIVIVLVATTVVGILHFPVYWVFVQSITGESMFERNPSLLPKNVLLDSFHRITEARPIGQWFNNPFIVAIGTVLASVPLAWAAAFSLSRYKTKFNSITGIDILATKMLSAALLAILIYMFFRRTRILYRLIGLTVANTAFTLPMSIRALRRLLREFPRSLTKRQW